MAKPKKAKLKGNDQLLAENASLERGKPVVLNIDGLADDAIAAKKLRIQVRVFFRANGIPFANKIFEGENPAAIAAGGGFDIPLADRPTFVPQHKSVHSFRVLAWDTTTGQSPKKVKDARSHVVRLRVK